jgi:hypothetical protein
MYIYIRMYMYIYTHTHTNTHTHTRYTHTNTQVGHLERLLQQLALRDQALGDMARLDNPLAATNSGGNISVMYICIYVYVYVYTLNIYVHVTRELPRTRGVMYLYICIYTHCIYICIYNPRAVTNSGSNIYI